MSYAKQNRKKAKRKELDAANPERKRIRRMIKNGVLPAYKIEVEVKQHPVNQIVMNRQTGRLERVTRHILRKTTYTMKSTFALLTSKEAA